MDFLTAWAESERIVFATCYRLLHNSQDAQDATQETAIRAWLKWHLFDGRHPTPWLCRIATNYCIDQLRHSHRITLVDIAAILPVAPDAPEDEALAHLWHDEVAAALATLPPTCAEAVILAMDGRTGRAAAVVTGATPMAMKSRLSRGRVQMRQRILRRLRITAAVLLCAGVFAPVVAVAVR